MRTELRLLLLIIPIPYFICPAFAILSNEPGWYVIGGVMVGISIPVWIFWYSEYRNELRGDISLEEKDELR